MSKESFIAVSRFGLGAKPGELEQASANPRAWLTRQLQNPRIPQIVKSRQLSPTTSMKDIRAAQKDGDKDNPLLPRNIYISESAARFQAQVASDQPLVERLVMFWSNHFAVSIQKNMLPALVNQYEVEAIRPYAAGYFKDLLLAVVRHPAMLLYLDNERSAGANSIAGNRRKAGLNENLAREIMELHSLGVGSGYTQDDVISLAKIITGWTLARNDENEPIAKFAFEERMHEPGSKTLLGRIFNENGEREGVNALTMLATHPATAKHIARKLAVHFISDKPSDQSVYLIERTFNDSGGHIPTVMAKILELPETWKEPLTKVKNPYEYLLSIARAFNFEFDGRELPKQLNAFNYKLFNADSPAGFPDVSDYWASPDAVMKKIEWAHKFSQKIGDDTDPMLIARNCIGDVLSESTATTIKRAASGKDGIALLLASPEFLRR